MGLPDMVCPRCAGDAGASHRGLDVPFADFRECVRTYIGASSPARQADIGVRVRLAGQLASYLYVHRDFLRFHPSFAAGVAEKFTSLVRESGDPAHGIPREDRLFFERAAGRLLGVEGCTTDGDI